MVANVALFLTAKRYYIALKVSKVLPISQSAFSEENRALPPSVAEQKRVVLFGDSRIAHWRRYPKLKGYHFINRGVGGGTTTGMRARFDEDVLSLRPDVVIIQAGINDLVAAAAAPDRASAIVERCAENLEYFSDRLTAKGIRVIFLTIIPPAQPTLLRRLVWNNQIKTYVKNINSEWLKAPPSEGVAVIDTRALLMQEQGGWVPGVNKDTLHLTPKGYGILNSKIGKFLNSVR